jgi:Caudovirus prohead protease.
MRKEEEEKQVKTFILLDGSVTTLGFRVLVEGVDTTQFERNPVMFYSHKDYNLPIGTWFNIRKENGQLLADANFDYEDTDTEVQRIIGKVERGIIKMSSVGLRDPEISADDSCKIEGQILPTIIKSRLREASIVAIGANNNALMLYDHAGALIDLSNDVKLSDFFNCRKEESVIETGKQSAERSHDPEFLLLRDKSFDELDKSNKLMYLKDNYPDLYKQKYDEKFKPESKEFKSKEEKELSKKTWDELDKKGLLSKLKKEYPNIYSAKYKEKFGKLPKTENKQSK